MFSLVLHRGCCYIINNSWIVGRSVLYKNNIRVKTRYFTNMIVTMLHNKMVALLSKLKSDMWQTAKYITLPDLIISYVNNQVAVYVR